MKKIMDKSTKIHKLLTSIVICTQVLGLAGTATVGLLQPTPQMAREATEQAGLSGWFGDAIAKLTQTLQPLWGEAATADASALVDVGPLANGQFLTTVHPEENMVVNGSFEMGPDALNQTNIPGWSVASGKVDVWGGYFRPDGSSTEVDLAGTPGPGVIEQTIDGLVAGQSYFFEFSYSANTFPNEKAQAQVLDGVTLLVDQTVTALGTPYSKGWQSFRQTFTAPASGSVKLRFEDLNTDPYTHQGVMIDDVRVARRLINYVQNGSFDAGSQALNQTEIPNWTVESGKVDVWNGYFNADQSTNEVDLAGTPGPGVINQSVSGLTAGQTYVFEFDYSLNAFAGEQAKAQVLDGASPLIDQTVTTNGDPNQKGWKHFRGTFTAPSSGIVALRFQDLSTDGFTSHGIVIDNVRVADVPLNYVVNGDFQASPAALNIASDAMPGWTITSGPVDNFHPGLLYDKAVDLNGSPGNGKIEQTVTGLTGGQVYAFQFNFANHASFVTYATARLLDSTNAKLYEKRVSCKGHVVNQGWCTLRYMFTAPANGIVKIVFENDETDGNTSYGTNIDNVFISRNLNYIVNGNISSGPTGLNQINVSGWADSGPTDTHDGVGGEYRFGVDLNGSPGDGKLRQVLTGLVAGQSYTLRYNYASTAHNYTVDFDVQVINSDRTVTLASQSHSVNKYPGIGGWQQAQISFVAPADGIVQVVVSNNETDNNLYYGAFVDNFQVWGQAATAGTEIVVCNGTVVLPRSSSVAPGGVSNGLAHWIKADAEVFSDAGSTPAVEGDSVQQWNDQSGAGLDLTQSTAAQKPTFRAGVARGNFNPTLDFNDDFIRNTSRVVQTTDDLTMIAVGDTNVTGGLRTLYGMGDNYNDPTMDLEATWISPFYDGGGTVDLFTTETLPTNQNMIWGMRGVNGDTNGMHFNYSGQDTAMNMTVNSQANYGQNVGMGSDGGGEDWLGRIPEGIIYNRNLSTAEMEKVYSYLAIKYGITMRLPVLVGTTGSGNYVNSAGDLIWNYEGNSNYHNNVAGIGRDDASGLEQKQSNSVNSGNLVTIGLGNIAADNASNIANFDADHTFLVWGSSTATTTIATSVSVSLTRMARIWAVQETNPITANLGIVNVRVPQSAMGLGAGQAAFLLRSADPVFTNADTVLFMTCDGTNCEAQIDFTDGDYFTFGRASVAPEIDVTPTSIAFGNVAIGETSSVRPVTITNSGNAPLNLTSVLMTNTGSGQFTNNNTCGAVLNPGASCTAGVSFTPNASGAQSGVLTIASNDSNEATTLVNLSGTGVVQAPDILVAPTTLTFSNTVVSNTAPAQSVVITNVGTGNLAIQNVQLGGADANQFVIVEPSSTCSPLTKYLTDGQSCALEVVFSPTSVGAKTATLTILSNDTDEISTTVTLNGAGITCAGLLNTVSLSTDTLEVVSADNSAAACVALIANTPSDLTTVIGQPSPNLRAGVASNVPMTVTNAVTASATTGPITTTMTLPTGMSAPASFSSGGNTCTTSGLTVTCVNTGTIPAGGTNVMTVPVTPNVSTVGTQPAFNGTTATPGETNTGNNPASPMTPSVAVAAAPVASLSYNTYDMQDGLKPSASPIANTCFSGSSGKWLRNAVYKTGYTGGHNNVMTPGETASESTFIIDIDKDGKNDIVWVFDSFGNGSNPAAAGVYIWKGNGDGTFATAATTDIGAFTGNGGQQNGTTGLGLGGTQPVESTHVADVNGDGNVDLIWLYEPTNSSYVWLGNGNGTFQHAAIHKTGYTGGISNVMNPGLSASESTFIVDVDGDNLVDIVWLWDAAMGNPAVSGVYYWKGIGDGTFATAAIKDVNTFTANGVAQGSVGAGTTVAFGGITATESSHMADFNNDGKVDILWTYEPENRTYVWLGNGDGTFQHAAIVKNGYTGGPGNIMTPGFNASETTHIVDADGDGKLDILWLYDGGVAIPTAGAYVWRGLGDGTFATAVITDIGAFTGNSLQNGTGSLALGGYASTESSHVADFNGDGKLDLMWLYEATDSSFVWMAGCVSPPDLTTTLGQPSPNLVSGSPSNIPVTVTNVGTGPTTGPVTTTMTLPIGVSAPATFSNNGWTCSTSGQTVTCTNPGPIANGGNSAFTVPVTPNASTIGTTPAFSATTAPTAGEVVTANNGPASMTPATAVAAGPTPDLTTAVGQPTTPFVAGAASNVPVTVTNVGTGPTTGPITTTMTLPAGTSAPGGFSNNGWSCATSGQTVTCTNPGPIANGSSSAFTVPVTPNASTVGTQPAFSATTAPTAGETNTGNNGPANMTPTTAVAAAPAPDLTSVIGQPAPALVAGVASNVPMTVSNGGSAPTTGPVTTTMTLPAGTSAPASFTSGPWSCTTSGQTVTCVSPGPIAAGSSSTVQVPVTAGPGTVGTTPGPFTGTVAPTAGETNTGNNNPANMTPSTPVAAAPAVPVAPTINNPTNGSAITNTQPVISGIGTPGATITVTESPTGTVLCTTTVGAGSLWSCTPSAPLPAGPHTISAVAANNVGPSPASAPVTFSVDNTAPAAPVITAPAASSTVNDSTPLFTGTAEPGSTVAVKEGPTTLCTAVADGAGNWACSPAAVMPDGAHNVTATATDPAGNVGSPSPVRSFTTATSPDLTTTIGNPQPALQATVPSTLPVTVNNIGVAPTSGPVTTTVSLPPGVPAPANFTSGPWACTATQPPDAFTASTATCTSSTSIPAGGSSTINVPVTPDPARVGSTPTFNATSAGGGEQNASNNAATPLTSSAVLPAIRTLPIKVFLHGPFSAASGIMSDGLRLRNLIPTAEPYTGLGFPRAGGGGETTTAGVLAVSGSSAVVDWVLVELRDLSNPATLVRTKAALLLRNGFVKDVDGTSDLTFSGLTQSSYFVSVRHRNHLGAMTANAVVLSASTPLQDFTTMTTGQVNGTNARRAVGSLYTLWAGNANSDGKVQAAGASNDLSAIVSLVLNPANGNNLLVRNYKVSGYRSTDVNLDGDTIAAGASNDVAVVVNNVTTNPINQPALNRNTTVDQRLP